MSVSLRQRQHLQRQARQRRFDRLQRLLSVPAFREEGEWSYEEIRRLRAWRSESPQRDFAWIAGQLRRSELSVIRRCKQLMNTIPNPLDQVELY